MAEKRVSVRLAAVGGRQVRAELEGVGEAGKRGFGRLSREMEAANKRLAAFSRRVRVASAAAVAATTAAGVAMVRSGLQTVDAQAKLAQSLGTTVASLQTLERAGELAGVSMSGIEQATKDLTRRLSQAASGNRDSMADRFRARAASTRTGAFDGVRDAMDALRAAMTGSESGDDSALEAAAAGADRVTEALEQAETAAKDVGSAGKQAGTDTATGADEALTGWAAVTKALSDYANRASETGRTIGDAMVSAFKGAEDALVAFVAKGKLDFAGLADAVLADITRIAVQSAILEPLARALGGAFGGAAGASGGGGGLLAGLFHGGGVVGETGAARMMPAAALAMAPRYHGGGMAGLRPDEVPAILQRGEMVLSRAQLRAMEREERNDRDSASDRPVKVVFNITTPDANSFRQSQGQIMAYARRTMARAGRNT